MLFTGPTARGTSVNKAYHWIKMQLCKAWFNSRLAGVTAWQYSVVRGCIYIDDSNSSSDIPLLVLPALGHNPNIDGAKPLGEWRV